MVLDPRKGKDLLFNLEEDPQERNDISTLRPDLIEFGKTLLESYVIGGDYMEPQASIQFHPRALPGKHNGVWAPFMSEREWMREYEENKHHDKDFINARVD